MQFVNSTTSTSRSRQVSSSNNLGGEPPSFDKDYWKTVAQNVKNQPAIRSAKLEALQKVEKIINEATSEEASWVMTHADGDVELFEDQFAAEASGRMVALRRLKNSVANDSSKKAYGGAPGNRIFQLVTATVAVPMLTSFFAEFAIRTKHLEYGPKHDAMKAFLHAFLVLAGRERGLIAKMTATAYQEAYGRIRSSAADAMQDYVDNVPAWKASIEKKISDLIAPAWKAFQAGNPGANARDFLPGKAIFACEKEGVRLVLTSFHGVGRLYASDVSGEEDRRVANYRFIWSPQQDKIKAIENPVEIRKVICWHVQRDSQALAEDILAEDVVEALRVDDPENLKRVLASIFFKKVQGSTYEFGLAAASEWMIKAAAAYHGYELTFSPAWTAKLAPDVHALVAFDNEKSFVDAAQQNFILRPMIDTSVSPDDV